jgi:hypothetical protein
VVFVWATGVGSALIYGTRGLGFTTALHAGPLSREKVAGLIGQLSPEDRAALLAQLGNGAAPAAAPAEKPAGKGKK